MEQMNSRDRVLKTLRHERADRVPVDGWFLNGVIEKLKNHFRVSDLEGVLEKLDIDFRTTCLTPAEKDRGYEYFHKLGKSLEIDDLFFCRTAPNEYENEWGERMTVTGLRDTDWHYSHHPLNRGGKLSLAELRFPDLDRKERYERLHRSVDKWKGRYMVGAGVSTLFRKSWILCGYERYLEALYLERDFVVSLLDRLKSYYTEQVKRYIECGVDLIQFGGDLGTEESMMISPDLWRELFKPRLKAIIEETRKEGVFYFIHSDGHIQPIIPDLVEIGFDIINPIQPECMDPKEIKRQIGDRATLCGTISLQVTLSRGSKEEIRNEVQARIRDCGYNGGLILSPSNSFTDDIPLENILYFYEIATAKNLGGGGHG